MVTNHVLQVNEGVINGHNLHLLGGESSTGHQTADAAESGKESSLVWPADGAATP